jgi:hypothetical protein
MPAAFFSIFAINTFSAGIMLRDAFVADQIDWLSIAIMVSNLAVAYAASRKISRQERP